jgi:hypothetical protein
MLLNVQLQISRSTLKQIVRSVLLLLGCIFWLVWPKNLQPCVAGTLKLVTPEPLRIELMCMWRFWLRISSGIKPLNSDLNSWGTLYCYENFRISRYYVRYQCLWTSFSLTPKCGKQYFSVILFWEAHDCAYRTVKVILHNNTSRQKIAPCQHPGWFLQFWHCWILLWQPNLPVTSHS